MMIRTKATGSVGGCRHTYTHIYTHTHIRKNLTGNEFAEIFKENQQNSASPVQKLLN